MITYGGCKFQSELDARWAVFFSTLGIGWEYQEPGGGLPASGRYLPSFLLEGRYCADVQDNPAQLDTDRLLGAARELGFLLILGPVPESRKDEYGEGDWGWSRVTGEPGQVNQYGFGTWYKDRRPWAHCDYVPPGPGWLSPVWCSSEANCAPAYAAARDARFRYVPALLPTSASPIEKQFWEAHLRLGLPALRGLIPQHRIGRYRIDFALPDRRTGIELDGFRNHSSTADIARDRQRQRSLEAQGWRIIRFGGSEVHHDAGRCVREAANLADRMTGKKPHD